MAEALPHQPGRSELDPRRWVTLAIIIMSLLIVVLDSTLLNVSIPTMLRDLHTELPSLQWVLTGYALTFATLLIIGGRLGDIYGARRMFIIGAALFGIGSLLASESTSVATLLVGEAVIEGIGAALMMPATLAILSNTFEGAERAKAFAIWGATAGAAVAFGPVVGGFLIRSRSSSRWTSTPPSSTERRGGCSALGARAAVGLGVVLSGPTGRSKENDHVRRACQRDDRRRERRRSGARAE